MLFLLAKNQFKRKLFKNGYTCIVDLLDTLAMTTEKDWKFQNNKMCYQPFPHTTIVFSFCSDSLELEIFEWKLEKPLFHLVWWNEENGISCFAKKITDAYDFIAQEYVQETDVFRLKKIMTYLDKVHEHLYAQPILIKQIALSQEKVSVFTSKEEKKEQLRQLLDEKHPFDNGHTQHGFTFQVENKPHYQSLTILFKGTLYYQALQMPILDNMETIIYHQQEKEAEIFLELADELHTFAKKTINNTSFQTTEQKNFLLEKEIAFSFEEPFKERILAIQSLLLQLKKDEKWLSIEAFHQVTETFPADIQALCEIYYAIEAKEKVQTTIEESLQTIQTKLMEFAEEVEQTKQHELLKRHFIIEQR